MTITELSLQHSEKARVGECEFLQGLVNENRIFVEHQQASSQEEGDKMIVFYIYRQLPFFFLSVG